MFNRKFKDAAFGTFFWIFFIIPFVIVPFMLPLALCRIFIIFLAKIYQPDLIPCNGRIESLFASKISNPRHQQNTNCVMVLKLQGKLDVEKFRNHFYKSFLSTSKLRQEYENFYCTFTQWMGYSFKRRVPSIDLEKTIRVHEDATSLESFVAEKLYTSHYGDEKNSPRWDISLIYTKPSADERKLQQNQFDTVVIIRMDHALADGYSFINIYDKLTGFNTPYTVKKEDSGIFHKLISTLILPKALLSVCLNRHWTKRIPQLSEGGRRCKRLISFGTLDLEKVKRVRRATQTHFNVVLSILQVRATRRYLLDTGRIRSEKELPEYSTVLAPTPISNHPAVMKNSDSRLLNQFGLAAWDVQNFTDGATSISPLLKAEKEFVSNIAGHHDKVTYELLLPAFMLMPARLSWLSLQVLGHLASGSHFLTPLSLSNGERNILDHPVTSTFTMTNIRSVMPLLRLTMAFAAQKSHCNICVGSVSDAFRSQDELDRFAKVTLQQELDDMVGHLEKDG